MSDLMTNTVASMEELAARAAAEEVSECWSDDEEDFRYESLGDLIDSCGSDWTPGQIVYRGQQRAYDPADWVSADDVIERLASCASDEAHEWADDYPEVPADAKAELQDFLETWARKHCTPTFWGVGKIEPYRITAEDLGRE